MVSMKECELRLPFTLGLFMLEDVTRCEDTAVRFKNKSKEKQTPQEMHWRGLSTHEQNLVKIFFKDPLWSKSFR